MGELGYRPDEASENVLRKLAKEKQSQKDMGSVGVPISTRNQLLEAAFGTSVLTLVQNIDNNGKLAVVLNELIERGLISTLFRDDQYYITPKGVDLLQRLDEERRQVAEVEIDRQRRKEKEVRDIFVTVVLGVIIIVIGDFTLNWLKDNVFTVTQSNPRNSKVVNNSTPVGSCAELTATNLNNGQTALICNVPSLGTFTNWQSTDRRLISRLPRGSRVIVVGSPMCSEGTMWREVQTDSGLQAWVAEQSLSTRTRYLCPVSR